MSVDWSLLTIHTSVAISIVSILKQELQKQRVEYCQKQEQGGVVKMQLIESTSCVKSWLWFGY